MKIRVTSADGIKCCLIYCGDGQYRLREYKDNHEFTDYDIHHSDLFVTIEDETASIYLDDVTGQMSIDYNPEILGLEDD